MKVATQPTHGSRSLILAGVVVIVGFLSVLVFYAPLGRVPHTSQKPVVEDPLPPDPYVAVLMPMEHDHLREVVEGFSAELRRLTKTNIRLEIFNAQGDPSLEKTMLDQIMSQPVDVIVPLTTQTTQRAIHSTPHATFHPKVLSLESDLTGNDRAQLSPDRLAGVASGFESRVYVELAKTMLPGLKKLTLIYASSDTSSHILDRQVQDVQRTALEMGIEVQTLGMLNQSELEKVVHQMASDSQLLWILKDNVVASGVRVLAKILQEKHIPLLTCDIRSVRMGTSVVAGMVGVSVVGLSIVARDVGKRGAELAYALLGGASPGDLPWEAFNPYHVYVTPHSLKALGVSEDALKAFAESRGFGYSSVEP